MRHHNKGGVRLPNICTYYYAAILDQMYYWWHPSPNKTWSDMESFHPSTNKLLDNLLLITAGSSLPIIPLSLAVRASLLAWKKHTLNTPPNQPLHAHPIPLRVLESLISNLKIQHWHTYGIKSLSDLRSQKSMKPFSALQNEFSLPTSEAYNYIRVSHFLKTSKLPSTILIPTPFHRFYSQPTYPKHGISTFYEALNDQRPYSQISTLSKWEAELNIKATPTMWQKAFKSTHAASHCSNHWENYHKTVHRWYLTPYRLSKKNTQTCLTPVGGLAAV